MHEHSLVHRLAPECKVVGSLLFVVIVALTPRDLFSAFGVYVLLVGTVVHLSRVRVWFVLRRLVIEVPFLVFLLALPFITAGETTEVLNADLSIEGLWVAWNVAIKSTLGLAVVILLAACTQVADLLRGLERLHVPTALLMIAGFMVRYADVVTGEVRRMRVARLSRGYRPSWLWQSRAIAGTLGSLFIRSFERGERVHTAMLSRGFNGTLPASVPSVAPAVGDWFLALAPPVLAGFVLTIGSAL